MTMRGGNGKGAARQLSMRHQIIILISSALLVFAIAVACCLYGFSGITRARAVHYAHDSLNQISRQLTASFDNIRQIVSDTTFNAYIQEYLTTADLGRKYIELYPILASSLDNTRVSNADVYDILLYDKNGHLSLSCQQPHTQAVMQMVALPARGKAMAEPAGLPMVQYEGNVYYSFYLNILGVTEKTGFMNTVGTCVILCNGAGVQDLVRDISIVNDARLFVLDSANAILASNRPEDIGNLFQINPAEIDGSDTPRELAGIGDCIIQSAPAREWMVYSVIPTKALYADSARMVTIACVWTGAAFLLILAIGLLMGRRMTKGVRGVVRFLSETSRETRDQRLKVTAPKEICAIAQGVNRMLDQQEMIRKSMLEAQTELYEAKLLSRQMSYTALQRQINPHFLYNTLNCIASICVVRDVPEVVNIASSMSHIFRYAIKDADIVGIQEELDCIRDYLSIIETRFCGKITWTIDADPAIQGVKMPKMILQPIVENAVFHGLEPKTGAGHIEISAKALGDKVVVAISDDGIGMPADTLEEIRAITASGTASESGDRRRSIGLYNISSRIHFMFKGEARIRVESETGKGTSFILSFPADLEARD